MLALLPAALAWSLDEPMVIAAQEGGPAGLPDGYGYESVAWAADAWLDQDCIDLAIDVVPLAPDVEADVFVRWDDVEGMLVVAQGQDEAWELVGDDDGAWVTDEAIAAGECDGGWSLRALLVHELGHLLGLSDSCSAEEVCDDAESRDSAMYWSTGACESRAPGERDLADLRALYGPAFAVTCTANGAPCDGDGCGGEAPLEVACTVDGADGTYTWDLGQGDPVDGTEVAHTYAAPGDWTVEVCGSFELCDGEPLCEDVPVRAREDAIVGGGGDGVVLPAGDGCGCATSGGGGAVGVLAGLVALARRRPRRR